MNSHTTDVCVAGAGPAGLCLALCLARAGHQVTVLEQSPRFDRTFRGESMSPDGVWLLDQLGVLDTIVERGALKIERLEIAEGGKVVMHSEFSEWDYAQRYPMEIPQPTLLSVLAESSAEHSGFDLRTGAKVTELIDEDGTVAGVRYRGADGETHEVRAALVVGSDGRYSKIRDLSGLEFEKTMLDRDVVWLRVPRPEGWERGIYRIRLSGSRHGLFIPTYPDDIRVGFNIPKGGLKELRAGGIEALHARMDEIAPELTPTLRQHVTSWSGTTVLDIFTVLTPRWSRPGLVLIGDAAHTLTPILGQGVNHALIDGHTLAGLLDPALDATGARRAELVQTAVLRFQAERESRIRISRQLQLRQERAFTFEHTLAVAARSTLYRVLGSSRFLQKKMLATAYFQLQPELAT
ncbi:oxidoreductase [Prauserella sp. PE36]|uniref:FAD-dependent oxidoreductase n=1 Tax=Prauserella sp. PE36 TaxID=1504709 RepID=UPI000DE3531C|nr:FAD-dependent oxidoreductase [Prauserella sp. PE36]RBM16784.1 oxidoreductase [Prauserella sp. PE36]